MHSFTTTYQEYLKYVTQMARKLSRGDRDLADDLSQEAWLALLQVPSHRWGETRYINSVLTRAMHRWIRRENDARIIERRSRTPKRRPPRLQLMHFSRTTPRPYIHAILLPSRDTRREAA